MARLNRMLEDWISCALITREQASKIARHEEEKFRHNWVLYGFLILGAGVLGLGIISLVAANWKGISDEVKLLWDFLLLFFVAKGVYWAKIAKKPVVFETLLVLFMILVLASIGLISQIFHTGGELWQALLLWSLITALAAAASEHFIVSFLWMGGLLSGSCHALMDSFLFPLVKVHPPLIYMLLTFAIFSLLVACRSMGATSGQVRTMNVWMVIFGALGLLVGEFHCDHYAAGNTAPSLMAFVPGYILALLPCYWIVNKSGYPPTARKLLLSLIPLYMINFHLPLLEWNWPPLYALTTLGVLIVTTILFSILQFKKLFHLFLVATGLRFFILYFQALGGLAITGWGLILAGLLIVLIVASWKKWSAR